MGENSRFSLDKHVKVTIKNNKTKGQSLRAASPLFSFNISGWEKNIFEWNEHESIKKVIVLKVTNQIG